MEAFRGVDDRFGNKMVGNYRPPCPLHSRTVSATFKWKNDKTAYIVRMTACVLFNTFYFSFLISLPYYYTSFLTNSNNYPEK